MGVTQEKRDSVQKFSRSQGIDRFIHKSPKFDTLVKGITALPVRTQKTVFSIPLY